MIGTAIHYIGSFLLLVALILTVVVDVTTPVSNGVYLLEFNGSGANSGESAKFGLWGWCATAGDTSACSSRSLGYNPADLLDNKLGAVAISNAREWTTKGLTRSFVVQPVGSGVLLLAFISSLLFTGSAIGGVCSTLIAAIAFIINAVAAVLIWVCMSLLRSEINDQNKGSARYGAALYLSPVAAAITFIATIIMLVTCCAGRKKRKQVVKEPGY